MRASLLVFVGSGLGGVARHLVNLWVTKLAGTGFPLGILIINVSGSLVMGLLAGWFAFKSELPHDVRLFLTTGIVSGYTTFSAFSLDAALLMERGAYASAAVYVFGSVVLSIAALMAALAAMRCVQRRRRFA